jgi:hypothetical protein
MGYLNSDTIVVDAILTKYGRKLQAQGQGLGITKFALSDDGVDYDLYNTDHPSGSAFYATAITSTPQLEATPDDFTMMTYKLSTLDRNIKYLPYIELESGVTEIVFDKNSQGTVKRVVPTTRNYGPTELYDALLLDTSYVSIQGGTVMDISGNVGYAAAAREIPQAVQMRGSEFHLSPLVRQGVDVTTMIKFTGVQSGAHFNVKITVKDNVLR